MNAKQRAVMIMNFLYIDEDKKHRDHEEFLENKQLSQKTLSAYINRFVNRKLQAEDHGFLSKCGTKVRMGENQEPTLRPKEKLKMFSKMAILQLKVESNSLACFEAYFKVLV
jgi:hypothetical protein